MKRLTEYTIPETGFSVVSEEKYKRILMEEKPSVEKVYNRLKKIEDILGDEYDLDELREMVQAKREGRCVVLPCKVGDEIYQPTRDFISTFRVRYIEISACGNLFINTSLEDGIVFNGLGFPESELGKTVFLTRAEAEEALRREQDGNRI